MIDIVSLNDGEDMGMLDTQTPRAANILSVQVESLEYAPTVGIDLRYFLAEEFKFQNESFKAYTVQVLANFGINVATVEDTIDNLFHTYGYNLVPAETNESMIAS